MEKKLIEYYISPGRIYTLLVNAQFIAKVFLMDITSVRKIIRPEYAKKHRGSKPRDPAAMLRSLLLMTLYKTSSIDNWVKQLRSFPFFAILSGFDPDDTPGVGTFYDFFHRLYTEDSSHQTKQQKKKHIFKRKPLKKLKKNEKLPPKHPGIVQRLVDRIIKNQNKPSIARSTDILGLYLQRVFCYGFWCLWYPR
ncbi:transposase [Candidatus Micrarchaeota archaeon]|nr:transposase [Candidatus Micrarchaeota archaeon]